MTLPANARRDRYVATAGQTVFPYTFRVFAAGDLVVERLRAGVTTTLVLTTDYTVSGVGADGGGNVTLTAGALAGDTIAIVSNQPNQRSTDFTESGDFRAAAVNAEFDRIWIGIQQLAQELARQITAPKSDPPSSYVLPPREARPNRLLGFDSNGDVVLATGATAGGINVSAFSAPLLELGSQAAWRSGIGAASAADIAAEAAARTAAIAAEAAARAAAIAAEAAARTAAIAALPFAATPFDSGELAITLGGVVTLNHGFSGRPRLITGELVCKVAELGIAADTVLPIALTYINYQAGRWILAETTASQIIITYSSSPIGFADKATNSTALITPANWRLIVRAYR
jgi:hypothetical protein